MPSKDSNVRARTLPSHDSISQISWTFIAQCGRFVEPEAEEDPDKEDPHVPAGTPAAARRPSLSSAPAAADSVKHSPTIASLSEEVSDLRAEVRLKLAKMDDVKSQLEAVLARLSQLPAPGLAPSGGGAPPRLNIQAVGAPAGKSIPSDPLLES